MRPRNLNEYTLNPLMRIYWRASLVPAAAVIPAPVAYIKVVAVKKLVVGSRIPPVPLTGLRRSGRDVYFEKIRVLKAGCSPE